MKLNKKKTKSNISLKFNLLSLYTYRISKCTVLSITPYHVFYITYHVPFLCCHINDFDHKFTKIPPWNVMTFSIIVGTVTRNGEMPSIQSSHLPEAHVADNPGPYFSTEGLWRPDYPHTLAYAIASAICVCMYVFMKVIYRDGPLDLMTMHNKFCTFDTAPLMTLFERSCIDLEQFNRRTLFILGSFRSFDL